MLSTFQVVQGTPQYNEDFLITCNEDSGVGYFLELDVQYPQHLHDLHIDLPFLPDRMKIEKVENLHLTCMIKKNILCTKKFKTSIITLKQDLILQIMS